MRAEYDPIAVLMEEHQLFLRHLEQVRVELSDSRPAAPVRPPAVGAVRAFARFLANDVDGVHGRKEEEGLFPALARHIGSGGGPIDVMVGEHEELRGLQRSVAGSVPKLESDRGATEVWAAVASATDSVGRLLENHIEKEDLVLFPLARTVLSPTELSEIGEICRSIEAAAGGGLLPSER